ncbi:MAG: hypothetical protein P8L47_01905 [Candidatus Marinamargulisbacteria bacterium]|nr:hypothetical protein [Candidatus Marinamargulisbacteria bacterium]
MCGSLVCVWSVFRASQMPPWVGPKPSPEHTMSLKAWVAITGAETGNSGPDQAKAAIKAAATH